MDDSYVLFKTYMQVYQAEMDLNKLRSEGIDAYLTDKNMGGLAPYNLAVGGVKVHIAEKDVEQAREILAVEE